jgi:hypothetical protein
MGRPEKPVNAAGGAAAQFAYELRQLRAQAGNPTYREMALFAMFSSSVLSSAASGNRMPSLEVTLAFVAACSGDRDGWRRRWLAVNGGDHTPLPAHDRYRPSLPYRRHTDALPHPAQLPQRPRGFVGRTAELEWLHATRDTPVMISGPAGVGKSNLALHYAHAIAPQMTDGQLYADLGMTHHGVDTPAAANICDILEGFLHALGVSGDRLPGTLDHCTGLYRTLLAERRLLVMLDNVQNERQVRPLLVDSRTSTTLLVSRKRLLGLRDVRRLQVSVLPRVDSVAMITDALPEESASDPTDRDRLAEICGDRPLALDIALRKIAARRHLTVRDVVDGWHDDRTALDWLCIGDLSMRDSLQSAYLTLSQPAQILLLRLANTSAGGERALLTHDDELAEEIAEAGMLHYTHHRFGGYHLPPLVRAFALDTAGVVHHGLYIHSTSQQASASAI